MIVLKILLILLAVILFLLCVPIFVRIRYTEEIHLRIYYLCFRYTYPPKRPKRKKKAASEEKGKKTEKKSSIGGILKGRGIIGFIELLRDITTVGKKAVLAVIRRTHVTTLHLALRVSGEDAAQTAIRCGYYSAAVYPALAWLNALAHVHKQQVQINPDYDAEETKVDFQLRARILPLFIAAAAIAAFFRYIAIIIKKRLQESRAEAKESQYIEKGGADQ